MKLVTFEVSTVLGPLLRLGALSQGKIIDLNIGYTRYLMESMGSGRAYEIAAVVLPPEMVGFFRSGGEGKEAAQLTLEYVAKRRG